MNAYHKKIDNLKKWRKRAKSLFLSVTSLSSAAFPTSRFVSSVEAKADLIFAEGVLDDPCARNMGRSVFVRLTCDTETDVEGETD